MSTPASRPCLSRSLARLLVAGGLLAVVPAAAQTTTTAVASAPPKAVVAPAPVNAPPPPARFFPMPLPPPPTTLRQISVGSAGAVWALDTAGNLWQWVKPTWQKKACCTAGNLSVTADGAVWATHPPNLDRVLRWAGDHWDQDLPAGMRQVTAVNAKVAWGLDATGSHYVLMNNAWQKKGCCVTQIAVANDGSLWATHPPNLNRVLRWNTDRWDENYPTGVTYITAGSAGNVWGLDGGDRVFKLSGTTWQPVPGSLRGISAAADGTVWGLDARGTPYRWGTTPMP